MVYTVPADRQAFMRESTTTDGGETLGSSTSGQGVSGHSSIGQDVPAAMAAIMGQATLAVPNHDESRGASFDVLARCVQDSYYLDVEGCFWLSTNSLWDTDM